MEKVIEKLKATEEKSYGFDFDPHNKQAFDGVCKRAGIGYEDQVKEIKNWDPKSRDPPLYPGRTATFDVISQKGREEIYRLENLLPDSMAARAVLKKTNGL